MTFFIFTGMLKLLTINYLACKFGSSKDYEGSVFASKYLSIIATFLLEGNGKPGENFFFVISKKRQKISI